MRVLCTCLPGYGHFLPMVPLARALSAAGHEVAFASAAEFRPGIEEAGFPAFAAGLSLPDQMAEAGRRFPEQHAMPQGQERFRAFVPRMLAGVAAAARARDLRGVVDEWRPDIVVHDETELGAPIVATAAGIPYADHSVGFLRPLAMARLAAEVLAPACQEHGVEPLAFAGLYRWLYLDVCPPSMQNPEISQIDTAVLMHNVHIGAGDQELPDWIGGLPDRPTVYVSLGTIFNRDQAVFATILEGLQDEDLNVILTIGADNDPAALGPRPDNVHVAGFIPQAALLPHCDVVVNQGGTAIYEILAHGLPLLVLPRGANQFDHAALCVNAGAARALPPSDVTADAVRAAVRALLDEPRYANAARGIAREIEEMPGPDNAVALLERLERERRPVQRCAVPR